MKRKKPDVADEVNSLAKYRKALAREDKAVFDRLLTYAKNHVSACAKSERNLFESMLLAIVLEQQKKIDELASTAQDTGPIEAKASMVHGTLRRSIGHSTQDTVRPQDFDLSILGPSDIRHPLPWVS